MRGERVPLSAFGGFPVLRRFLPVPEMKVGRAYTHPTTGTGRASEQDAFDTSQSGRVSSAACSFEISGFVVDQQPKRRKSLWLKMLENNVRSCSVVEI